VTNRGEWLRRKRKGYVKIHVAVETQTKQAVGLEVSDEQTHDSEKLVPLVLCALKKGIKVNKVLADCGYDTKANFAFLASQKIEAGIKVRKGSNPQCEGLRGEVVRAYLSDPCGWKQGVGYGYRWMAESFFSGFKRLYGEVVQARKWERIVQELRLKVWVYNLLMGLTVSG
jgi:transposase